MSVCVNGRPWPGGAAVAAEEEEDASVAAAAGAAAAGGAAAANRGSVRFDEKQQAEVRIEKARSSHVLVRPLVDGEDIGPFILDTGASGLAGGPRPFPSCIRA